MSFNLGLAADQEELRDRLHAIAKNDFRARAATAERDGADLAALAAQLRGVGLEPGRIAAGDVPEIHTLLVAVEEMAYGDAGLAWAAAGALQVALLVGACGRGELRERVAALFDERPAAAASFLAYEDFGRAPSEYETTATPTADGWRASGRKTSVAHPGSAEVSALVARESSGEVVGFAWVGERAGLRAERDDRAEGKLALTAVPSGPVAVDGLQLAGADRLGGGVELRRAVADARLLLPAALIGTARASIEFCAGYAQYRTTWGHPIAEYQGISFPLVEHTTEIDEVRWLLWDAAAKIGRLEDGGEIDRLTARSISRAASLGLRATRDGVQLIGVRAITRDLPSERWYRSAGVLAAIDFDVLQTPFGLN